MDLSNFSQMIRFAMRKEEDAADLYETYANLAERPSTKSIFRDLWEEEKKHKRLLEGVTKQNIEDYKLTDITNLKIAEYSVEEEFRPDMNFQEALLLAIKKEEKSQSLYNGLAQGTKDPQLKKLFQTLAQEEAKHKLKLEKEYDEHVLTWN